MALLLAVSSGCTSRPVVRGDAGAFTSLVSPRSAVGSVVGADYRIGSPDRVAVRCDRVRGLDVEATVDADGYVSLPTLGQVKVVGLTAEEASAALTRRVRTVDPNAAMSLTVTRYASRHVYAFGGVRSAGPVAWRPGMRLVDALSEAGLSPGADVREVSVIRPGVIGDEREAPRRVTVDIARLLEEGDASVNLALRAGDLVVVPERGDRPAWTTVRRDDAALAMRRVEPTAGTEALESEGSPDQPDNEVRIQPMRPEVHWGPHAKVTKTSAAIWPVANRVVSAVRLGATPLTDSEDLGTAVGPRSTTVMGQGYFGTTSPQRSSSPSQVGVVFWN